MTKDSDSRIFIPTDRQKTKMTFEKGNRVGAPATTWYDPNDDMGRYGYQIPHSLWNNSFSQ